MNRKQEILNSLKNLSDEKKIILEPYVDNLIDLENQLLFWKKQPQYKIHPNDKTRVKPTDANYQYLKVNQQYTVAMKLLISQLGKTETKEESPLRIYLKGIDK